LDVDVDGNAFGRSIRFARAAVPHGCTNKPCGETDHPTNGLWKCNDHRSNRNWHGRRRSRLHVGLPYQARRVARLTRPAGHRAGQLRPDCIVFRAFCVIVCEPDTLEASIVRLIELVVSRSGAPSVFLIQVHRTSLHPPRRRSLRCILMKR
jgi:hypothetical protein